MKVRRAAEGGMSLVAVLLATGFFSTVALGLALVVSTALRTDSNYATPSRC